MSVAMEIARVAGGAVPPGDVSRIVTVGLQVGRDAGVDPSSLEFCLTTLLALPPFGRARPVLDPVPGMDLTLAYLEVDDGRPDD